MFEILFKALGEPTRLKIIRLLADRDLCVCDLEAIMQISQPRISQHLKVLKHAGLVSERKEGQRSVCSLNRELLEKSIKDFGEYINKPLNEISGLAEEWARMPSVAGDFCARKTCE